MIKFEQKLKAYSVIPGNLIAYWASDKFIEAFERFPKLKDNYQLNCGIKTGNNDIFLRLWYEISLNKLCLNPSLIDLNEGIYKWFKYNKGGGYRKWYGGYEYVVNLKNNAEEIKSKISKDTYRLRNSENYFKNAIIWPLIGDIRFSARLMNSDTLSDVASNVIFMNNDIDYGLISIMNSKVFNELLKFINSTVSYPIDSIANVPIKIGNKELIEFKSKCNINLVKVDWDSFETSWDFKKHPLI